MRNLIHASLVTAVAAIGLAGCTAAQQNTTSQAVTNAAAVCTAGAPVATTAGQVVSTLNASQAATVSSLLTYYNSVCDSTATIAAAAASASAEPTATWLTAILGGILQAAPAIAALI